MVFLLGRAIFCVLDVQIAQGYIFHEKSLERIVSYFDGVLEAE